MILRDKTNKKRFFLIWQGNEFHDYDSVKPEKFMPINQLCQFNTYAIQTYKRIEKITPSFQLNES